jgi:hypothetical protein
MLLRKATKATFVFVLIVATTLTMHPAIADEDCWNFGTFEKTQLDKKEKSVFSGDIKEVKAVFDYDLGEISGSITWNRIPTSGQTTNLIIGFNDNMGDCVTVSEAYKMKGWTKKFSRDWEVAPRSYSPDMLGKFTILESGKNSLSFSWLKSKIDEDNRIGEHCVSISTTIPSSYYKTNTTCFTSGSITTCDGPGRYATLKELDLVIAWAKTKWESIHYTCTF